LWEEAEWQNLICIKLSVLASEDNVRQIAAEVAGGGG
jgi:hypothetical protein